MASICLRFSLKHIRVPVELRYLQNALLKHPDIPSERYIIRMIPLKLSSCFNIQTVVDVITFSSLHDVMVRLLNGFTCHGEEAKKFYFGRDVAFIVISFLSRK